MINCIKINFKGPNLIGILDSISIVVLGMCVRVTLVSVTSMVVSTVAVVCLMAIAAATTDPSTAGAKLGQGQHVRQSGHDEHGGNEDLQKKSNSSQLGRK